MKPKVYLALPLSGEALARVEAGCDVVRPASGGLASRDDLLTQLGDSEGMLATTRIPIDAQVLDAAPKLRVVSNFGVGYDNIDVAAATEHGVLVCNTPGVLTDAVADLTMGLVIALARRLVESVDAVRGGQWMRGAAQMGSDVRGKTLGIVGLGRIGRAVAQRARAFGMHTCFADQFDQPGEGFEECLYRSLDDLLREADFVTLHVDLNEATYKLIGARELALMKPAAFLINTSRGQVVDQAALAKALEDKTIAGAALDVLEQEPPDAEDAILRAPNVIVLPHIGSATRETRTAMLNLAIDNLLAAVHGETPPCMVNPEALNVRAT
jgi:phosphoglycerate dehydrogenase-like enzyme